MNYETFEFFNVKKGKEGNLLMKLESIGSYKVITNEGKEYGIFFRNPIQKVFYDAYYEPYDVKYSAYDYAKKIKNPFRRFFEYLLGNKNIIKNLSEWLEEPNFGGFRKNVLCSPIYFSRDFQSLSLFTLNDKSVIKEINSYGYSSQFEEVAGGCVKEKTVIKFNNKNLKTIRKVEKGSYKYTYSHIIKEFIKEKEGLIWK